MRGAKQMIETVILIVTVVRVGPDLLWKWHINRKVNKQLQFVRVGNRGHEQDARRPDLQESCHLVASRFVVDRQPLGQQAARLTSGAIETFITDYNDRDGRRTSRLQSGRSRVWRTQPCLWQSPSTTRTAAHLEPEPQRRPGRPRARTARVATGQGSRGRADFKGRGRARPPTHPRQRKRWRGGAGRTRGEGAGPPVRGEDRRQKEQDGLIF